MFLSEFYKNCDRISFLYQYLVSTKLICVEDWELGTVHDNACFFLSTVLNNFFWILLTYELGRKPIYVN